MTPKQYVDALHTLQTPLRKQQATVAAVAKKFGLGSYQYQHESKKEALIIADLYLKEMELLWKLRTSLYTEKVKKDGKESVLAEIINEGKQCEEHLKEGWRKVYLKIKSL